MVIKEFLGKLKGKTNMTERFMFPEETAQRIADSKSTKPPLGVEPAWIAHDKRLKELVQAIERAISVPRPNYGRCIGWAFEIQTLCAMLDKIYRMVEKN